MCRGCAQRSSTGGSNDRSGRVQNDSFESFLGPLPSYPGRPQNARTRRCGGCRARVSASGASLPRRLHQLIRWGLGISWPLKRPKNVPRQAEYAITTQARRSTAQRDRRSLAPGTRVVKPVSGWMEISPRTTIAIRNMCRGGPSP